MKFGYYYTSKFVKNMFFIYLLLTTIVISVNSCGCLYIDDFTKTDIANWKEQSDTIKNVGKSKAILTLHQNVNFQRAVLFTLVNPQSCGAGFAGVQKNFTLDLSAYHTIQLKIRGQGQIKYYKFIIKQAGSNYSFCHIFEAPEILEVLTLLLDDFKPFLDGKLIEDPNIILDRKKIISIGIIAFGGKYYTVKQKGVASLEIDWIQALT